MEFFTRTDTHLDLRKIRSNSCCDILNMVRWNLRYENLTAKMMTKSEHHKSHTILKRDIEASHAHVSNRKFLCSAVALVDKERYHGTTRSHHVAITNHGETNILKATNVICSSKEFIACEFGRTIKVDWSTSLVGRECDNILYSTGKCGRNDILGTIDIGLDTFVRIILSSINLLDGGSMDNDIHSLTSLHHTFAVSNITNEVTKLGEFILRPNLLHIELFQLTTRIDDDFLNFGIITKNYLNKFLSERARASGNQNYFTV